jgi:hypothetical protein
MSIADLTPGDTTTRAKLAEAFGLKGGSQGGIIPVTAAKKVLVFSDPNKGEQHGYTFDGQAEDDDRGTLYLYTGAGQTGDQKLSGVNGSLLRHQEAGREVHLFVADGKVKKGSGEVRQRYIGEVIVDLDQPYEVRYSTDSAKRRLYVFRLRPAPGAHLALTPKEKLHPAAATTVMTVPTDTEVPEPLTGAVQVPTEQHATDETVANVPGGPVVVVRREGKLSTAFEKHLLEAGHSVCRHQIVIKGERGSLMTDLYDVTDNVLYEAKGRARRNDVRLAIGQLLDYRRHIEVPPGLRLAVLLPSDPGDDLRDLLAAEDVALVFQTENGFEGFPLITA